MKADTSLLQHKIEILNKQLSMQENENANLEKCIKTKNNLIGTLEEKASEMSKKISDLQDEVLSLKFHNCRIGNLQPNITTEIEKVKNNKKEDSHGTTGTELGTAMKQYNEAVKETNHRSDGIGNSYNDHKQIEPQTSPKLSNIRKVQIVGTSNVKYLFLKYIAGTDFNM